jgi:DNA-nicking Smr family endonuclease
MAVAVMTADDVRPRRRRLTAEEHTLWSRITRSVAPLRRQPMPAPAAAAPVPSPASKTKSAPSLRPHPPSRDKSPPPKPAPLLEPLDRRLKQRLARGSEPIEARIDLHGRTQDEAHAMLLRFLRKAQDQGAKFALVITGKGARARDEWSERGVLKRQVPLWLKLPEFRVYVVGFEPAHVGHGGEGALYVRIKKPGDRRRRTDS